MKYNIDSIKNLIDKYGDDEESLLRENPSIQNLYLFSSQRNSAIDWLEWNKEEKVLLLGGDSFSIINFIKERVKKLVIKPDNEELKELLYYKYKDTEITVKDTYIEDFFLDDKEEYNTLILSSNNIEIDKYLLIKLKALLAKDARLIIISDNRYGIKYLHGVEHEGKSVVLDSVKECLRAVDISNYKIYYPLPDYRVAYSIFSDDYLPQPEDNSYDLPAYTYPKLADDYMSNKLAKLGRDMPYFANSFIIVVNKLPDDIYIKYNRNRKEEYRIRTSIHKNAEGNFCVKKTALNKKAFVHILSLEDKYKRLSLCSEGIEYIRPLIDKDSMSAEFEFIMGQSVSKYLCQFIEDKERFIFETGSMLEKIIGKADSINLDSIFDNFILKDDRLIGIDYEWVEDEPVDKDYIKYRILHEFYQKNSSKLNIYTEKEFLDIFGLEDKYEFKELERVFQEKVHGESKITYLDNYLLDFRTEKDLLRYEREFKINSERLERLSFDIKDRDLTIRKQNEIKRLTDNHVNNLEIMIKDLKYENSQMAETIAYLSKHEALIFRVKRKLGVIFNRLYPKGSIKRKKLSYVKVALLHPIRYIRLINSEEGKNLIEGDFKIGDVYKKYGKLEFTYFDNPKVSIIIPAYNQVYYTYACLVSILENTKDIEYEVIIADDVSTDATKEIEKFASNLVVSRNTTNQGFLKNCNNAAKSARGEYILFLNNDTKVTADWLTRLLALIESDKSIGMVGSKLIYPDGRLQEAGGIVWSDGSAWNYGRLDDPKKCEYNYVKDVDYISGAAIMLSKRLWEEIGGFDERFAPAYCEDSDLAFEVRKAGYRVCYQPKSEVIHFEGISNGTDVNGEGLKKYQIENSEKLKQKWVDEFKKQGINNGNPNPFKARERSYGKKIILFIDHYVPTYDKDAGSKTTFQYLELFIKKGYIIKFLGDNFLKEEPYTSKLESMGIEVLYGADMQSNIWEWIEKNSKDIHIAYINRPHIASKYIDFIKERTDIKIIYYGHDLHFLREEREFLLTGDTELKQSSRRNKFNELSIMSKASMNYYPSQIEVDCVKEIDDKINVKAITAYIYDSFKEDINTDFSSRSGLVFVGGFAHRPNIDAVLWFVDNIWEDVRRVLPIDFYIVGSKATEQIESLHNPEKGIIFKGFVSDEELENIYQVTKLAIVPLRYGAGIKGKVIEAMYNGIPVITTSVGAEGIKEAGEIMQIADTKDEFIKAIISLYKDNEKLLKLQSKALDYIKKNHSMDAAWDIIEEDFK